MLECIELESQRDSGVEENKLANFRYEKEKDVFKAVEKKRKQDKKPKASLRCSKRFTKVLKDDYK